MDMDSHSPERPYHLCTLCRPPVCVTMASSIHQQKPYEQLVVTRIQTSSPYSCNFQVKPFSQLELPILSHALKVNLKE